MYQILCQKLIHLFALNSHNHLTSYITLEMINRRLTVVKELAQGPRDRTIWDGMEAQDRAPYTRLNGLPKTMLMQIPTSDFFGKLDTLGVR